MEELLILNCCVKNVIMEVKIEKVGTKQVITYLNQLGRDAHYALEEVKILSILKC